ncbi:MAG: methyltransferase domain-containing protein [Paracoccaceae bacterium]
MRPALDLLAQVPDLPEGAVVDLGCGDGAAAAALRARFPGRRLVGVDASPAMLQEARGYDALDCADIATWRPEGKVALIFSNAVLHWLDDHAGLMPRLAGALVPGGVLAIQMPRQFNAPSHRFLRDIAAAMFPDRFDFSQWRPPVERAEAYWAMLAPLGQVTAWETDYVQRLDPAEDGHPVRRFTESTVMRPFAERMEAAELARFVAAYEEALAAAYPLQQDGSVLFPFRRVFLILGV